MTVVAGNGTKGLVDGAGAAAMFDFLVAIVIAPSRQALFVTERGGNVVCVQACGIDDGAREDCFVRRRSAANAPGASAPPGFGDR